MSKCERWRPIKTLPNTEILIVAWSSTHDLPPYVFQADELKRIRDSTEKMHGYAKFYTHWKPIGPIPR